LTTTVCVFLADRSDVMQAGFDQRIGTGMFVIGNTKVRRAWPPRAARRGIQAHSESVFLDADLQSGRGHKTHKPRDVRI